MNLGEGQKVSETQKHACMTVTEVAEELGVSRPVAYAIANRSDFPAIRFGRRLIVPRDSFGRWLEEAAKGGVDLKTACGR